MLTFAVFVLILYKKRCCTAPFFQQSCRKISSGDAEYRTQILQTLPDTCIKSIVGYDAGEVLDIRDLDHAGLPDLGRIADQITAFRRFYDRPLKASLSDIQQHDFPVFVDPVAGNERNRETEALDLGFSNHTQRTHRVHL